MHGHRHLAHLIAAAVARAGTRFLPCPTHQRHTVHKMRRVSRFRGGGGGGGRHECGGGAGGRRIPETVSTERLAEACNFNSNQMLPGARCIAGTGRAGAPHTSASRVPWPPASDPASCSCPPAAADPAVHAHSLS